MDVKVNIEYNEDDDGVDGTVRLARYRIEDTYGMAQFFSSVMQAAGFTYVKDVGFLYDDGREVWGEKF